MLRLADKSPQAVMEGMRALGAIMVRTRPVLRGLKLSEGADGRLEIQLRIAGHTRWEIQRDARKIIVMLLRRVYIIAENLELRSVTTERNGRELYTGEGRTPMTKKKKAPTKPDGRPWDHYEWWGDDLSMEPVDDPDSRDEAPEVAPWFQDRTMEAPSAP